jgi:methyl acetate hydrolase
MEKKVSMIDTSAISTVLKRGFEAAEIPCVVAAAATIDGPIFAAAFGKRNLDTNAEMTTDTIIQIASMTKAVAGACAMQLVERGQLELDSPISTVLPDLSEVQVLDGFDSQGEPKLRAPKRPITLRDLLTHTSGFTYGALNASIDRYVKKLGIPTPDSRLNASLKVPLAFDPGAKWEYGIGIDWAGKAVEAVSGLTLGQYMKRNVLDPLGMNDTGFMVSESQRQRLATVYQRTFEGLKPINRDPPPNAEFESGGGGLYSTIQDYLKFIQMLLHNGSFAGQQVLRPETVALMGKNSIGNVTVRALRAVSPEGTNPMEFIEGMKWACRS